MSIYFYMIIWNRHSKLTSHYSTIIHFSTIHFKADVIYAIMFIVGGIIINFS